MGLKIINYSPEKLYPIDEAHPEEYDVVVYSDISGDDITEEELWVYYGKVCSREEMEEAFYEDYVSYVEEDDYDEAKQFMINNRGYEEKDFLNHPTIVKVANFNDDDNAEFEDIYEFEDYLNNNITEFVDSDDVYEISINDLTPEEDSYDSSDDDYDKWVESHL